MSTETTILASEPLKQAGPQTYQRVFGNPQGELVLLDLQARFLDRRMYVPGGQEGARETEARAAQADVVRYILTRLGQTTNNEPEAIE